MVRMGIALLVAAGAAAAQDNIIAARPDIVLRGHRGGVSRLDFNPDATQIASTGDEGDIRIWDLAREAVVRTLAPKGRTYDGSLGVGMTQRRVEALAYHPDGSLIAESASESSAGGTIRLWNTADGTEARVLASDVLNPRAATFSPDGKFLAANTRERSRTEDKIVVFDVETGEPAFELRDDRLAASLLAFSPDGTMLASAGATKLILWDLSTRKIRHTITGFKRSIVGIAFRGDSGAIATVTPDDSLKIWNTADGKLIREIKTDQDGLYSVAFNQAGKVIATGGGDRSIKLWNSESGRRNHTILGHEDQVVALTFSRDGKRLGSADRHGGISIWRIDEAGLKDLKDDPAKKKKPDPRKP